MVRRVEMQDGRFDRNSVLTASFEPRPTGVGVALPRAHSGPEEEQAGQLTTGLPWNIWKEADRRRGSACARSVSSGLYDDPDASVDLFERSTGACSRPECWPTCSHVLTGDNNSQLS
ncbi:Uroporphyrinogen decarboxylase [Clarias magur]|uniref:Uroporphyrinogen decarboxylase n=1 Tax=Clarias magur TaxID=1594786 RepID=A0A8J4TWZ5_CLAMG|nr:Uroporphyrinogen decarboxylase [Clarias magur]